MRIETIYTAKYRFRRQHMRWWAMLWRSAVDKARRCPEIPSLGVFYRKLARERLKSALCWREESLSCVVTVERGGV
jgi:hypothetical protein